MSMIQSQPPIMLSICIPTYNRQSLVAQTLEDLKWTLNVGMVIEIIVSDNASDDDTEQVVKEIGRQFPHFRYVRQKRNVGGDKNALSVMRLVRGKYFVKLSDDDRLIQGPLLAEIDYMNHHEDVIISHAPWKLWNDVTDAEVCNFYNLEKAEAFTKAQSADLFNFIVTKHIFPEIAVYRTQPYLRGIFEWHQAYTPFIEMMRALHFGTIRFQPEPFCRVIIATSVESRNKEKSGVQDIGNLLDQYRAGLEIAASLALSNMGMRAFNPDNRLVVLDLINDFICTRMNVAAKIAQAKKNFIQANILLKRSGLWAKDPEIKANIRKMEEEVSIGSAYQAMKDIFDLYIDAQQFVLCEISNGPVVLAGLAEMAPEMVTVIHTLSQALDNPYKEQCVYLVETENVRSALLSAGVDVGRVLLASDLLRIFQVSM